MPGYEGAGEMVVGPAFPLRVSTFCRNVYCTFGQRAGCSRFLYCAIRLESSGTLVTGGGFHLPVSASDFGAYRRMVRLKGPLGAGNQLASLSGLGLAF